VWGLADPLPNNLSPILATGFHLHVDLFHQSQFTRKIDIELGESLVTSTIDFANFH